MLRDDPDLYTEDVRTFLEAGELMPATRYIQALRVRQLMQRAWAKAYEDIDLSRDGRPSPATRGGRKPWTGNGVIEPVPRLW